MARIALVVGSVTFAEYGSSVKLRSAHALVGRVAPLVLDELDRDLALELLVVAHEAMEVT